jgi:hypothetical protein
MSELKSKNPHPELSLLLGSGADATALRAYLDGLSAEARIQEVRSLARPVLKTLYERCEKSPPLKLIDMVPESTPVGATVIFAGLNNLPLHRLFEKRFARTPSGTIIGYNHQSLSGFVGPGYFTVEPAGDELVIDYTKVPTQAEAPTDWPKVQPNDRGLSHFVYKNMQDYCRSVSKDVVIGHATKQGKSLPHYFVLARRS